MKIFFIITKKIQHLYHFYLIWYIFKGRRNIIHTYIHINIYTHVDLKYVYKHILLFTNRFIKKNLQYIIVVQMYEIVKIQMHF